MRCADGRDFLRYPYILLSTGLSTTGQGRLPGPSGRVAPVSGSVEAECVIEHVHPPLGTTLALLGLFLVVKAVQLAHIIAHLLSANPVSQLKLYSVGAELRLSPSSSFLRQN